MFGSSPSPGTFFPICNEAATASWLLFFELVPVSYLGKTRQIEFKLAYWVGGQFQSCLHVFCPAPPTTNIFFC